MASLNRSRKRQSRLAFTPLPSSSPAAKDYNKQIQERAAAVTLESSPDSSKRRKLDLQLDGVNDSFPTPAATNRSTRAREVNEDGSENDEPVRSTQRRSDNRHRKRSRQQQQRLDFSNVRDADSFSPPMKLSSPLRPHSSASAGAGMFCAKKRKGAVVDISSDEGSYVGLDENNEDQIDSDEELPSPAKFVAPAKTTTPRRTGRHIRATRSTQPITVESDSEKNNIVVNNRSADPIAVESDDDDDEMPTTIGTQRRERAKRKSRNSFISSSPPQIGKKFRERKPIPWLLACPPECRANKCVDSAPVAFSRLAYV